MAASSALPLVAYDTALPATVSNALEGRVRLVLLEELLKHRDAERDQHVVGIYTYLHPTVDGDVMDRFPNLRVVSNYGVGVDHIDVKAAVRRGVSVGNTPGVLDDTVADTAIALVLAAARKIIQSSKYATDPSTHEFDAMRYVGVDVHHKTLGIIGMGRIGQRLARRANGFDMRVLYHNRNRVPAEQEAVLGAQYCSLEDLLSQSDFVCLCTPLTSSTTNIINAATLRHMKPSAFLVNVARGGVVNHDDLTAALQNKQIAGAALDVSSPEPLPRDHPLLHMENVIFTPHIGSASIETRTKMALLSVENLLKGLNNEPLVTPVL